MRKTAYFFIVLIGIILTLSYGQAMIIQFIIAYLLWFATVQLRKTVNKLSIFRRFVPQKLQTIIILVLLLFIASALINALIINLTSLIQSSNDIQGNIIHLKEKISGVFNIGGFNVDIVSEITKFFQSLNLRSLLTQATQTLSSLLSNSMMIFIYLLFMFLETDSFTLKIKALFPEDDKRKKFLYMFDKIEHSLSKYFKVKTFVSLLTASLSFIVFTIVGIQSPLFWAFLIFLMNYIPTIGSIIATVFPVIFSLLQFARFTPAIIILVSILVIQQVVGNFIEPKLMGKTLNISPIVTILSLTIWGQIWGVMGMLLSVPITVTAIILLSQFESTRKIAILLSEKGSIMTNED